MNFHLETTTSANFDEQDQDVSEAYWRRTIYFPIIDPIINNLKFRFSTQNLQMAKAIDIFMDMDFEKSQYFIQHYMVHINYSDIINSNTECLKAEMLVALTIPVSSATCERSFSSMRRLKNWMRTSMVQQCFTNLSVINFERDFAIKIVPEEILNTFAKIDRRLCLTFY
ncbi:zinc finger MYM-type protein 1-like [Aphis craccivora]|uniref:Zinc finger MYM-type protein 1-like n=1 Tax=Aphis craccivora TaxID=307492 RepID=A0A6G0W5Y4_APHCR|nr:zinc finger MYM-type protein 1-like [Aphis craccivora]